jgi:glycopeptide antibiotics resistance protein
VAGLVGLAPPLVFAIIWLSLAAYLRLRRNSSWVHLLLVAIFGVYLYAVLDTTILQFQSLLLLKLFEPNLIIRGLDAVQSMNLLPLVTLTAADVKTSLLNVLLFAPFGFGLPFLTSFRFGKVVLAGALFSLAIEVLQFVTGYMAGVTFRVADINDVVFNTAGSALGYLLSAVFVRLVRRALGGSTGSSNPLRDIANR